MDTASKTLGKCHLQEEAELRSWWLYTAHEDQRGGATEWGKVAGRKICKTADAQADEPNCDNS